MSEINDEMQTIIFKDEETKEDLEVVILESLESNNTRYILVVEAEHIDEEEAEAMILKEKETENQEEVIYEMIEDDDEFYEITELFRESSEEFDLDINQ